MTFSRESPTMPTCLADPTVVDLFERVLDAEPAAA
jgi:hypothetical protein